MYKHVNIYDILYWDEWFGKRRTKSVLKELFLDKMLLKAICILSGNAETLFPIEMYRVSNNLKIIYQLSNDTEAAIFLSGKCTSLCNGLSLSNHCLSRVVLVFWKSEQACKE